MYEILRSLRSSQRVLDLGCDRRSFAANSTSARVVRVDREIHFRDNEEFVVQGDASRLPFPDATFDAIVLNHSLEHFDDFHGALREIARVAAPRAALFISVPDASTLCDKLYRWLSAGGGHVNPFTSAAELASTIERETGLKHVGTKTLFTSLSFLNRRNSPRPRPKRLMLLGGGHEQTLFWFAWLSRKLDRHFGLRLSVYGWALWFGNVTEEIDSSANVNVCLGCGCGASSILLRADGFVSEGLVRQYRCPQCGTSNPFSDDLPQLAKTELSSGRSRMM